MMKPLIRLAFIFIVIFLSHRLMATETIDAVARICERFPELSLSPTTAFTFHTVTDAASLQTAITTAFANAGDDIIQLDGRTTQTWEGSSPITINGTAAMGCILIVSQNPTDGSFSQPITFKGFGISIEPNNSAPIYLANLAITEARTLSGTMRTAALNVMGTGILKGSSLSITNSGATTGYFYAGGLFVASTPTTLYNTTIANTLTAQYGAVTAFNATVSLVHCTLAGNQNATSGVTTGGTSAISQTNCLITTDTLAITATTSTIPHCVPKTSSAAIDGASTTTSLTFDALGKARIVGTAADLGAVEVQTQTLLEPPADLVALPSGPREVYLGWSEIARATDYQLERSIDNGSTWTDITSDTLWRTPYCETNPEGTITGWTSARYRNATPGETALYRLSFTATGETSRIFAPPQSVTSPALDAIPRYHSRTGASRIIYLDFTGYIDDTAANVSAARVGLAQSALTYIQTAPFVYQGRFGDLAQDYPTSNAIYDIWRMVAEDFAAFDVDVTTEAPSFDALIKSSESDMAYGKRVVIGYAKGTATPWYPNSGAFSGGGTFGFQHDRPVYVFSVQSRQNIAAQITHEVSHTLGLAHDGGHAWFYDAFVSTEYYRGVEVTRDGTLNTSLYSTSGITWFPVMGGAPTPNASNGYYYDTDDFINQWNTGTYASATNTEDDFAILLGLRDGAGTAFTETPIYTASKRNLTLAEDDAGDTFESAQSLGELNHASSQTITATIGKHLSDDGQSVINDVDVFAVDVTEPGFLEVAVVPNYQRLTEGASLDAKIELLAADGTCMLQADEPRWDEDKNFFDALRNAEGKLFLPAAGTYFIRVSGTVHPVSSTTHSPDNSASNSSPWHFNATDNQGSIGPYTLTTTFTADDTIAFSKPRPSDTTDYTADAKIRLIAANDGIVPTQITANNGSDIPPTAAELSAALLCFDNILLSSTTDHALHITYHFNVVTIESHTDTVTVTIAIKGADDRTAPTFAEKILLLHHDINTDTTTPIPDTLITQPQTTRNLLQISLPYTTPSHLFQIIIRPSL